MAWYAICWADLSGRSGRTACRMHGPWRHLASCSGSGYTHSGCVLDAAPQGSGVASVTPAINVPRSLPEARVLHIVDGDTIQVSIGGRTQAVR